MIFNRIEPKCLLNENNEPLEYIQKRQEIVLFTVGSKFAHSCSPTIFTRYDSINGEMVYTCVRRNDINSIPTVSYLPEHDRSFPSLVCGSAISRIEKLWNTKFFKCMCDKCSTLDPSSRLPCPNSDCQGICCRLYNGNDKPWTCNVCSQTFQSAKFPFIASNRENILEKTFAILSEQLDSTSTSFSASSCRNIVEPYLLSLLEGTEQYSPLPYTHWTFAYTNRLLAIYHLEIFGKIFGHSLARSLKITEKGYQEALIYFKWLDQIILEGGSKDGFHDNDFQLGNPIAATFSGWPIAKLVLTRSFDDIESETSLLESPLKLNECCIFILSTVKNKWLPLISSVFKQDVNTNPQIVDETIFEMNQFIEKADL